MGKLKNILSKIRLELTSPYRRAKWLRKKACHVGENVVLVTTSFGAEPYLLWIGDNVTVAVGVKFITHDASVFHVRRFVNYKKYLDKVGAIVLEDNCFVGGYSILLPNTGLGKNSILAAGSVLTKKVPDGEVWGGNPAHFLMTTDEYAAKIIKMNESSSFPWIDADGEITKCEESLITLRQHFFLKSYFENTNKK